MQYFLHLDAYFKFPDQISIQIAGDRAYLRTAPGKMLRHEIT